MQRTALGAADVPDVKSNAHRASTSGSAAAGTTSAAVRRSRRPQRRLERLTRGWRILVRRRSGSETRMPTGQLDTPDGGVELRPGDGVR